ncbi:MAG TPA: ABC transporter permease [Vicinamibacterales bacterium]|nr:ABC transporter permease [Vicinamibacterales bacterium]
MFETIWQDIRLAVRTLRGSPLFTLTAVLSLAVGIAGTAVIFAVVDAYLLRPWPGIADPARLVEIGRIDSGEGPGPSTADGFSTFSYPNYQDYLDRQTVLASFAASRTGEAVGLGDGVRATRVPGAYVSSNYFSVLGAPMALGRGFLPEDESLTSPATVAIISHRLWRSQFQSDGNVIGRNVQLNGRPFTIVGVASAGFNGHDIALTSIWIPLTGFPDGDNMRRFARRGQQWLMGIGRLKEGVSAAQARAEMTRIASDLAREYPDDNRRHGLGVEPSAALPVDGRSPITRFLALFSVLIGLVLLIACTNVGGMVLARGVNRAREMAVRLALGAERRRLVRLLITESVVVALAGAALGLLLAWEAIALLGRLVPIFRIELTYDVQLDWRVTAFSIGVAVLTVIACGLLPAVQATRIDLSSAMKPTASSGPKRLRARQVLLAVQVALSMLLVISALLLGRSLRNANAIDPGFMLDGVDVAGFDLRLGGYGPTARAALFDRLMSRVQALPGLESAALVRVVPLTLEREGGRVWLSSERGDDHAITVSRNFVSPDYFRLFRIPLLRGRVFDERDRAGAPEVAIINETMANRWWPGRDPVGQLLVQGVSRRPLQIVGVVRDTKYRSIGEDPTPFVYISAAQTNESVMRLLLRANGRSLLPQVRAIVAELDPNLPLVYASTLTDLTAIGLVPHRLASWLAAAVAIDAAFLAGMGIYGLAAYNASQRTREIGVRVALGALRRQVMQLIIAGAAVPIVIGAAIGLLAASLVTTLLAGMLYGVQPRDPVAFLGGAAVYVAVALIATLFPARRAASVNLVEALRAE